MGVARSSKRTPMFRYHGKSPPGSDPMGATRERHRVLTNTPECEPHLFGRSFISLAQGNHRSSMIVVDGRGPGT